MLGLSAALACAYQLAPPLAQPRVPQRRAPPPAASSFAEIGLRGELCAALAEAGITEPNDLQRRVMPALAGRADVLQHGAVRLAERREAVAKLVG